MIIMWGHLQRFFYIYLYIDFNVWISIELKKKKIMNWLCKPRDRIPLLNSMIAHARVWLQKRGRMMLQEFADHCQPNDYGVSFNHLWLLLLLLPPRSNKGLGLFVLQQNLKPLMPSDHWLLISDIINGIDLKDHIVRAN